MDGENPYRHPEPVRTPKQESKKDSEFPVNLRLLLLRKAGTWDPSPQCLQLDKLLLQQQNTKKLFGTKNNCVHEQLEQILDTKDTKVTKKIQLLLLKSLE